MKRLKLCAECLACIALAAVIVFALTACDNESADPVLTGTVSISGYAVVGQTLTANIGGLSGNGTISYQWKRGNSASAVNVDIGVNADTYTLISADDEKYITVTVSRAPYTGSVVSAAIGPVTVNVFPNLSGNVTISPAGPVRKGTPLTANYSGTEIVTFRWNKDGAAVSGAVGVTHTPTQTGSYTVTASTAGYNSKTSATVTVIETPPEEYITMEFGGFGDETIDLTKSAENDISQSKSQWIIAAVHGNYDSYQWYIDGQGWGDAENSVYLPSYWFSVGIHTVAAVVTLNGIPYSKELTFRVVL